MVANRCGNNDVMKWSQENRREGRENSLILITKRASRNANKLGPKAEKMLLDSKKTLKLKML